MALRINTEPMEQRQMALTVEVDQERVDQELKKAARKLAGQYRIPGFRRGKAPYNLLVQHVGLPALFQEFLEPLGQEIYPLALEEAKLEPYAPGALDVESLEPLTYKFIVPLEPEIDLGDYRALRVEEPTIEVTDEEIDAQLEEYRAQFSEHGEVERPSEYGDLITLDVKSVIAPEEEGGEEVVVLDETDWDVTPDDENPMDPPGFDEALLGLSAGDEKDFVLSWPEDSQSIHAGKEANFHVKIHKIEGSTKPALDDAFAQMVGPEFETLDALKENIRTTLLESKQQESEEAFLESALDALMEQSTLDYPPAVVEDQLDTMVNTLERQLREYGIEHLEQYLEQMGQTVEQYRDSMRPQAEVMAKRNLLISEIFRQEGITVSEDEIEARIDQMLGIGTVDGAGDGTVDAAVESASDAGEAADEDVATEAATDEATTADAETDEATAELAASDATEDTDAEEAAPAVPGADADTMRSLREMMKSGSGRSVLESQILQENSITRLLAIVRGEELPPRPEPVAEVDAADETAVDASTDADATADTSADETDDAAEDKSAT